VLSADKAALANFNRKLDTRPQRVWASYDPLRSKQGKACGMVESAASRRHADCCAVD
jgi:hypothetical protein